MNVLWLLASDYGDPDTWPEAVTWSAVRRPRRLAKTARGRRALARHARARRR